MYKLLFGRPIDSVDAEVLFKENKRTIDEDYLKDWAKRLKVANKLERLNKKDARYKIHPSKS